MLLVAGGEDNKAGAWHNGYYLSSTEILRTINGRWTVVSNTFGHLPYGMFGLRAATLDNTVYMTG